MDPIVEGLITEIPGTQASPMSLYGIPWGWSSGARSEISIAMSCAKKIEWHACYLNCHFYLLNLKYEVDNNTMVP
jgi:hypothetical protein